MLERELEDTESYEYAVSDDIKKLDLENTEYFHEASKNCDCCKGYINKCKGPFCQELESCYCFAVEEQEDLYEKKKNSNF